MFNRLTDNAKRALGRAAAFAREQHHETITVEHVLIGLLGEGDVVRLHYPSVEAAEQARERLVGSVGRGQRKGSPAQLPFSAEAKAAFDTFDQARVDSLALWDAFLAASDHGTRAIVASYPPRQDATDEA